MADDDSARTDPVADGIEQLQRLATEAISAARAMLDAAEAVVKDPAALDAVVNTVAAMAKTASDSVAGLAGGLGRTDAPASVDDDDDDGFQRIRVS